MTEKKCSKCGEIKDKALGFYRNGVSKRTGEQLYASHCRACQLAKKLKDYYSDEETSKRAAKRKTDRVSKPCVVGNRYNDLVVIEKTERFRYVGKSKRRIFVCLCDCGNTVETDSVTISNNNTKSCGCRKSRAGQKHIKVKVGDTYGRLVVKKRVKNDKSGSTRWHCVCICGGTAVVTGHALKSVHTSSCGCLQRERTGDASRTHGLSKTASYKRMKVAKRKGLIDSLGGACSAEDWQARLDYYGGRCVYCGTDENITQEHRIPVSKGGTNQPANLVPACKSCNCKKGTKTETKYKQLLASKEQN